MTETGTEKQHLEFEQQKWRDEVRLRERELEIKERDQKSRDQELVLKQQDLNRSSWSSPLVIAIFGAGLAAIGNLAVTWQSAIEQRRLESERATANRNLEEEKSKANLRLEDTKSEAARILEVVKTNNPDAAAVNLQFLLSTGLIADPRRREQIETYLRKRQPGEGFALPAISTPRSFDQMKQVAIDYCISQRAGQPDAQRYCSCLVNGWVNLWNLDDLESFTRKGVTTAHMAEMEGVAAAQCSGKQK
jgi:hypothetical protein